MKKTVKTIISTVHIRPITAQDLGRIVRWLGQKEISDSIILAHKVTLQSQQAWYKRYRNDPSKKVFAIEVNRRHVGNISLFNIDPTHKRALLTIFIGDRSCRGKGIGSKALRLLFDKAFMQMKLVRVGLEVRSDNASAIRCYRNIGMTEEGELRSYVQLADGQHNMKLFSMLRKDYVKFFTTKRN